MKYYNIVRFYKSGRRAIIRTGLTLEQAQKWCSDLETRKEGKWFDGFVEA
jgi:hypothetical protein